MPESSEFLTQVWSGFLAGFTLPGFVGDVVQRVLAEEPPTRERAWVLSHNDLNPNNLVYNGEAILILDWATAGPMDAFYDLAVISMFLCMDEGTSLRLLSAYEGTRVVELPHRFRSTRRLAAALAGTFQLHLARQMKHAGATGAETLDSTPSLGQFYQRMQTGAVKLGTAKTPQAVTS